MCKNPPNRAGRPLTLAAALVAGIGLLTTQPLLAQDAETGIQSQATQPFDIPAGPLASALNSLAQQAGLALTFDPGLTRGKTTGGLAGEYTLEQALQQLLAGSGLSYRFAAGDTVTLLAQNAKGSGPLRLSPINVEAEGGRGRTEGFRAEISRSATNVPAPLMETPATANVLTGDFLDSIDPRGVEEAMQYVAGAGVENAGDPFSPKFNLRGFTVNSLESGGIYVDRYQAVRRGYHFDRSLYARSSVLKGTSAVLYGLATPGGVVNYVAKKPQFDSAYRVEGSLGNFDASRFSIDFTGALNQDRTLAYRLIATVHQSNQTVNGENSDLSFDDRIIISPSLTWKIPTGGTLYLNYEYSEIESVFDPGIKRLDDGRFLFDTDPFVGPASGFDREINKGKVEYVQPLAQSWDLLIGGVITRSDNVSNIDAAFFGNLDGNPMPRWTAKSVEDYEQTEFRAELNGEFFTGSRVKHQLTLGLNYLRTELSVDRASVTTDAAIDPFNPQFGPAPALGNPVPWFSNGSDPEKSAFIQDYLTVGKLKVFGGVRYTEFEVFREHITARDFRNSDEALDWNLGAIYNQSTLVNPFVSYATSTEPQDAVSSPKEGEQIEVGMKSQWLGGDLATTASIFQIRQTDIAEEFPANSGSFRLVGDQRTRGVELEAQGRLTDQFRITAGYSYLDAEFSESTTGNEGNRPHSVPEHKVTAFGEYVFTGDLRGWSAGLGFIHVGDRQGDNANRFQLPDYERVDLTLAYAKNAFEFRAKVENVLDEDYIVGSGGTGHRLAQGAPRLLMVSAGYSF